MTPRRPTTGTSRTATSSRTIQPHRGPTELRTGTGGTPKQQAVPGAWLRVPPARLVEAAGSNLPAVAVSRGPGRAADRHAGDDRRRGRAASGQLAHQVQSRPG